MGRRLSQLNDVVKVKNEDYLLVDGEDYLESKKIRFKNIDLSIFDTKAFYKTEYINNNFYNKKDIENLLQNKQDILVDERNIKTLNGQSLLGEGNLEIEGSIADQTYTPTSPNAQSGLATAEAVGVANNYTDKAIKSLKTYANNTFAPAIKNTVSGSVLAVHDVSPVEYDLDVRVRSKNLWTNSKRTWGNNFTVTFEDSNNITATVNGNSIIPIFEWAFYDYRSWGNSITLSFDYEFVNSTNGVARPNEFMCIGRKDGKNTFLGIAKLGNDTAEKQTFSHSYTIDTDADYDYIRFAFYGSVIQGDFENYQVTLTNIQLELGSTATDYTPYVSDLSTVSVSRYGENLWDFYNLTGITDGYTVTKNGLTATIKDGYITIAGTHTYSGYTNIIDLGFKHPYVKFPSGTYSMPTAQGASQAQIFCSTSSGNRFNTFTMNALFVMYGFYVSYSGEGTIVNDKIPLTFISGPIRPTDYKPYIQPQTVTANADGTVEGLTSISPNMTVTTDTQGVVIDMTYNADTKMYIDNKLAEISTAIVNNV